MRSVARSAVRRCNAQDKPAAVPGSFSRCRNLTSRSADWSRVPTAAASGRRSDSRVRSSAVRGFENGSRTRRDTGRAHFKRVHRHDHVAPLPQRSVFSATVDARRARCGLQLRVAILAAGERARVPRTNPCGNGADADRRCGAHDGIDTDLPMSGGCAFPRSNGRRGRRAGLRLPPQLPALRRSHADLPADPGPRYRHFEPPERLQPRVADDYVKWFPARLHPSEASLWGARRRDTCCCVCCHQASCQPLADVGGRTELRQKPRGRPSNASRPEART